MIKREIRILQHMCGGPNIIRLLDVIRDPGSQKVWESGPRTRRRACASLVFEYVENVDASVLYPTLSDWDIRHYMFELLRAVDHAHSHGIMHRDVKPLNVAIDPTNKTLRLLDWGLADFYHPGQHYSFKVAARYYKGPELLFGMTRYDCSLDVWSLGCMLAGMVFRVHPFFKGADNCDQLERIARVLGTRELLEYAEKHRQELAPSLEAALGKHPGQAWSEFATSENGHLVSEEALDLIDRMLVVDHALRILPSEALKHQYFEPLRVWGQG
ncbi:unnamed protein product [Prorocentrum cordatum]|uniref:non-specific serine/threonine protein kinase n=1 Tax=Prorocentrum cordatum TaxID=2364126 RepID=A0ABN9PV28_9DINO|nr:unnamed protein product [Polarella glacialis]